MNFKATISRIGESELYWTSVLFVPEEIVAKMIVLSPSKRIVCKINDSFSFHCAMILYKNTHFIMFSKEKMKLLGFSINDEITVEIIPDTTPYGIDISEELNEVLETDDEGKKWFEKLTPGKQRSLIFLINKIKNSQIKINKSFVILDHLKRNKGTLDFKLLNEDFKNFNSKNAL